MTKQELMENYTAEQLAEMVLELTWKMWTNSEECKSIPPKVSIIVKCPDCGKPNKIELDEKSECLIRNKLTDRVHELQSEVEKYRKAFEDAKKECDCQVAEYRNRVDKDKSELERAKNTINQIDYILEKLFDVRHDTVDKPDEFEKILKQKAESYNTIADYLCDEPISVAQTLISAKRSYELSAEEKQRSGLEKGYYHIFDVSELRQIAEHLLVYCNHNVEAEE